MLTMTQTGAEKSVTEISIGETESFPAFVPNSILLSQVVAVNI